MILQVALIAAISVFSPLIGLVVSVPFFAKKIFSENPDIISVVNKKSYSPIQSCFLTGQAILITLLGIFTASLLLLFVIKILSWQRGFEVWVSVGLASVIFALVLRKLKSYEFAILYAALPGFVYVSIKNLFFFNSIKKQLEQSQQLLLENIEKMFSPEILENMMPTIIKVQNMFLNGNAAIWMFGIILGLFIGALILSNKLELLRWNLDSVNFPFYLQIAIAIGLILFIFKLRIISYNLLVICGFFFLIQGYSLLYFFMKRIFKRSYFLGIILLIIPFFNYYLLIMISILGFLDTWIHFRKFALAEGDR
ncbi:MAG: hypothetical protein KAW87_00550 [Candidatus Cloacimonetes bacterium]|nr:hypothetical protein [Candidatus Cloacimonadota bacterium]